MENMNCEFWEKVKNKYKSYKDDVAYSKALDYFDDSDFKNFMKTARLLTAEEPDP